MESPEESNCEFGNCKRPPSLLSVQDFGSSTLQKRDAAHPLYGISHSLLLCHKHFFSHTTDWANPVFRKIFKCSSRCDTSVRISYCRIILISTWFTNIFFHFLFTLAFLCFIIHLVCASGIHPETFHDMFYYIRLRQKILLHIQQFYYIFYERM